MKSIELKNRLLLKEIKIQIIKIPHKIFLIKGILLLIHALKVHE